MHDKSHRVSRNAEKKDDHTDHRTTQYNHRTRPKFHHTHKSHQSSTKPRMHTESFSCASVPSFHTRKTTHRSFHISPKALSKFPNDPQTEVFTRPNKPFKFPYPHESTPKFRKRIKPRFPSMQNDLSKFPRARTHPRFSHINNHQPNDPKNAHSRFLNVQ